MLFLTYTLEKSFTIFCAKLLNLSPKVFVFLFVFSFIDL